MKHEWSIVRKTQADFCKPDKRVCEHCGSSQEYLNDQDWGRIVRRYWYPKVGRCSGVKK